MLAMRLKLPTIPAAEFDRPEGRMLRQDAAGPRVKVAVVNEELARSFGYGRDIVGKQFDEPGEPITIVGMVGNVRARGLQTDPYPEFYPEFYPSSLQLDSV